MSEDINEIKNIEDRIMGALDRSSLSEVAILLNSEYVKYGGKMLYAKIEYGKKTKLLFYTKSSERSNNGHVERYNTFIPNGAANLTNDLLSDTLYGIKIEGTANVSDCLVKVDETMRLLILESNLYHMVKVIIKEGGNSSFRFGKHIVTRDEIDLLMRVFKQQSYKVYGDLVYKKSSNAFLKKLKRRGGTDFYKIQSSFVPVFVDYSEVYNPMKDNNFINNTQLHAIAVEKDRRRENQTISCYYLTHLEICKALGMTRFMRFTPSFLYRIFIGLAYPDDENFPHAGRNVYIEPEDFESIKATDGSESSESAKTVEERRTRSVLTFSEMDRAFKECDSILNGANSSTTEVKDAKKKKERLLKYIQKDSLLHACEKEYPYLMNLGPIALDNDKDKTALAYHKYLSEASIEIYNPTKTGGV